jgi:hypothetical protein
MSSFPLILDQIQQLHHTLFKAVLEFLSNHRTPHHIVIKDADSLV